MDVYRISEDFDFDNISLTTPTGVQGGAYFSKLKNNNEKLFVQTSKCSNKNGIKKSGKKLYCDLMFNNEDTEFYDWMEKMEEKVKSLILKNRESWFHDELEKEDIDYNWNSGLRTYKQKFYLFRTFIEKQKLNNGAKLQIFNEEEEKLTLDDVKSTSKMVCILEIKGLKFTSQSFHLECSLTQIMLINEEEILMDKCLIRREKKQKKQILENEKMQVKQDSVENENIGDDNREDDNIEDDNIEDDNNDNKNLVIETDENIENDSLKMEEKKETLEKNEEDVSNKDNDENIEKNLEIKEESLEKNDEILEVNLELPDDLEINKMKLKKPNEVYIEMYRSAKNKAKLAKKLAIQAYLESKEIKKTYMLDLDDSSDDEDLEKMINNDETDENNKILN